jgi:AcrR family transcriptional regulator
MTPSVRAAKFLGAMYIPVGWYISLGMAKLDHRTKEARAAAADMGGARGQLLDAAARVFSRRGYEASSINEIVGEAGFSKGALYWHFAGKEDLFFALLDERIDQHLRGIFSVLETSPAEVETAAVVTRSLSEVLERQRELVLMFHEFSTMAARDPRMRDRYIQRNARLRAGLTRAIEARHATLGVPITMRPEDIATAVIVLSDGFSIGRLADPDGVSDDLLGEVLSLIYDGLAWRAREASPSNEGAR